MNVFEYDKPCPYDTNGDGNCGKRLCPYCGIESGTWHGAWWRMMDQRRRAEKLQDEYFD